MSMSEKLQTYPRDIRFKSIDGESYQIEERVNTFLHDDEQYYRDVIKMDSFVKSDYLHVVHIWYRESPRFPDQY